MITSYEQNLFIAVKFSNFCCTKEVALLHETQVAYTMDALGLINL